MFCVKAFYTQRAVHVYVKGVYGVHNSGGGVCMEHYSVEGARRYAVHCRTGGVYTVHYV
jgi:hypothetical protein